MKQLFAISAVLVSALVLGASMTRPVHAAETSPCQPERWAADMARFEQQDAEASPPKEAMLFVGSSSIRLWNLEESFPDLDTINRGFGGSQLCDSVHYAELLVLKHKPAKIVLYAGDNDVAAGKTPQQVAGDFSAFVAKVRQELPETPIIYIAIKPSIARWKLADKMSEANKLIEMQCSEQDELYFVDVWQPMLGDDGEPRGELFRDDGLHLNKAGYELWTELVKPLLVHGGQ